MPPESRKGYNILNGQSKLIVNNVYLFMKRENERLTESQILDKTSEATKIPRTTIWRIVKESDKLNKLAVFQTTKKKQIRPKPVTGIDDFDQGVIKRIIHNFHITDKELPTIRKLKEKLKADLNFQGSETSLRKIVKSLGFRWKKTENNRKILIEKSNIRLLRIEYLKKIKNYRQENRPIIYTDESYVHSTHAQSKSWSDGTTYGLHKPMSKGQRAIIVHAGSENGFVPNALLIFKSGTKSGDYHDDMNFQNYEKWLRNQLIPNLPRESVVVVDNAAYHNKQYDPAPNSTSRKSVMQAWLKDNGIQFDAKMYKPELYALIKTKKETLKKFSIDKIFAEHNHAVLRLPPYHPDLNPIEMAWASIKGYVSSRNVTWNYDQVVNLVREKVEGMGANEWQKLCAKVMTVEEEYSRSDHTVDLITDNLIIRLGHDSDTSDSDTNSQSDNE